MTDHFALLDEPRRPWLDVNNLKQKFLALSAEVHPDRVHGASEQEKKSANERYTQLNAAFQCLSSPRDRVRHFLELELGRKPDDLDRVPNELMDAFMVVGQILREADAFLVEKQKASSPLLQVQFFERGQEFIEKLEEVGKHITATREKLSAELREISGGESPSLNRLEEIYRLLGYYDRWLQQIQERRVRLSF
jgi:DnaJ-domain-containing protein 1